MAEEKKYIAVFDAVDKASAKLLRIEKATKSADAAIKKYERANEQAERAQDKLAKSTVDQTTKLDRMTRAANAAGRSIIAFGDGGTRAMRAFGGLLGGITRGLFSLPGMIAGAGAAFGAWKLGEAVIGGGMQKELTQMQMGALLGSKSQGADLYTLVQDKAMQSMFSEKDFSAATNAFLPVTKDFEKLSKLMDVNERLASSNMLEGMDGASFSLREAMSGDIASIAERFNISKSDLRSNGFDSSAGWEQNLNAVDKTLDKMGYTAQYVDDVNGSTYSQMQIFKSNFAKMFTDSGEGLTKKLGDPLKRINSLLASEKMSEFVEKASDAMANGLDNAIDYVDDMNLSWSDFDRIITGSGDVFKATGKSFQIMMDAFTGKQGSDPRGTFETFAGGIESVAGGIESFNKQMKSMFDWMEDSGFNGFMNNSLEVGQKLMSPYDIFAPEGKKFKGMLPWMFDAFQGEFSPYKTDKNYKPGDKSFIQFDPTAGSSSRIDGSHATGLKRVPFDGYIAELHRDEEIVPASEARRQGGRGGDVLISNNTFHVRSESDIHAIGQEIVQQLKLRGAF